MSKKKIYIIFMAVFAIFIAFNFCVHIYRTNAFNLQTHTIEPADALAEQSFTFSVQNGNDISWTRTATLDDQEIDLYARSYEGIFTNESEVEISEWTMRLDFQSDCYLNSAWCGIVEIHQHDGGKELVQTLDLRNFDKSTVILNFYEDGDIFLFPMTKGDYLIYYPDLGAKEYPLYAENGEPGKASIGAIIYWDQTKDLISPEYLISYKNHKRYLQGTETIIFFVTSGLWVLMLVAGCTTAITSHLAGRKSKIELDKKEVERQTSEKMLDEMIKALAYTIDAKDGYTHGHSQRVAQYALKLAQAMNLSDLECKEIFYAGLVHDVGKIAVPEHIINKEGKLTDEEFAIIKSHPSRGEKILLQIEDMPYLAVGAKYHHERYDGFGYPSRAKGEDIPLMARIIAVADSYDAMTSQRSYRKTLDQNIVRQEIWKGIGTQFDPLAAKHMIALIDADVDYDMREKKDETYALMDKQRADAIWKNSDPKSIRSVEKIMSATDIKYYAEFITTIDQWSNAIKLSEIPDSNSTGKDLNGSFFSKTLADAPYVWHVPTVIFYTSSDGEPIGKDYMELAVFVCAGYSWKTGVTVYEESHLIRNDAFGDWNNWLERNKEGIEYRINITKNGSIIDLSVGNDLITVTGKVELPDAFNKPVYVAIAGENCSISDLQSL